LSPPSSWILSGVMNARAASAANMEPAAT
jgi:hypothetical protein